MRWRGSGLSMVCPSLPAEIPDPWGKSQPCPRSLNFLKVQTSCQQSEQKYSNVQIVIHTLIFFVYFCWRFLEVLSAVIRLLSYSVWCVDSRLERVEERSLVRASCFIYFLALDSGLAYVLIRTFFCCFSIQWLIMNQWTKLLLIFLL